MATTERKLREVRKRLGMTQGDLAQALGVTQGTISRWEAGSQSPDFQSVVRLAGLAGVEPGFFVADLEHDLVDGGPAPNCRIVGSIRLGHWADAAKWEVQDHISVKIPMPRQLSKLGLEGYILDDLSGTPYFRRGSIVFVDTDANRILKHENYVVIAREDGRGLFEVTLKEVYVNQKGAIYFSTVSDDPEYQDSLKLRPSTDDRVIEGTPIIERREVVGVVVAAFRVEVDGDLEMQI